MAIIRKYAVRDNYTQIDNRVLQDSSLSDAAKVLYVYMSSHKNAFQLNDGFTQKVLGWGQDKITRNKRILKDAGLILIHKIDRQTYYLYIGSSQKSATQVKLEWDKNEGVESGRE